MSDYDPDEIVQLPGVGNLSIRSVVRRLADGTMPPRAHYDLFRDTGRQPSVLTMTTAEAKQLAALPEYRDATS